MWRSVFRPPYARPLVKTESQNTTRECSPMPSGAGDTTDWRARPARCFESLRPSGKCCRPLPSATSSFAFPPLSATLRMMTLHLTHQAPLESRDSIDRQPQSFDGPSIKASTRRPAQMHEARMKNRRPSINSHDAPSPFNQDSYGKSHLIACRFPSIERTRTTSDL